MSRFFATLKAIITRLVFAAHGFVAIWQVTIFKKNYFYWYLSSPILLLFFEGIFTLTIKQNQEWKWFCPSVFLYLSSIVPAIWLLELDKVDRRLKAKEETFNFSSPTGANFKDINNLMGVQIKLPEIPLSTETWVTLIEQFLMLILIIGRWMLPKGDLTRDQLSQLLLVYIGTAADIIEFFDSFKDDKIASEPLLVLLTLGIWSWSLMQFTVVLTATKSRKSRLTTSGNVLKQSKGCCSIDVWGIALNITLQDAPFLVFRLLLITHFNIISYMNVFFTCKNTLVILLQLYRLYVVYSEHRKQGVKEEVPLTNISIISKPDMGTTKKQKESKVKDQGRKRKNKKQETSSSSSSSEESSEETSSSHEKHRKRKSNTRKDTGYSTGSSHTSSHVRKSQRVDVSSKKDNAKIRDNKKDDKKHSRKSNKAELKEKRKIHDVSEESERDLSYAEKGEKKKSRKKNKKYEEEITVSASTSTSATE